ncbi:predicted protein [Plenodomus lingam JN3]|uniref:Predicted protein n=1 Tax=Leptosphaeria maculans (strain JN3 / isolate v23.1.3 / race Av1-4-5-6-7-8) TaxID=985895 RepID=E4ZZL6_LEPMJ|nr:predicted protein [Plenodomus lingam JN3]CBX97132.1 predicted protein [Plenodomus lingam JN3]
MTTDSSSMSSNKHQAPCSVLLTTHAFDQRIFEPLTCHSATDDDPVRGHRPSLSVLCPPFVIRCCPRNLCLRNKKSHAFHSAHSSHYKQSPHHDIGSDSLARTQLNPPILLACPSSIRQPIFPRGHGDARARSHPSLSTWGTGTAYRRHSTVSPLPVL